jgi:hypothetical protein
MTNNNIIEQVTDFILAINCAVTKIMIYKIVIKMHIRLCYKCKYKQSSPTTHCGGAGGKGGIAPTH